MRNVISATCVALGCIVGVGTSAWPPSPISSITAGGPDGAQTNGGVLTDWLTDGGDNQRTGWQRNETILTKDNVKNLKVLWKIQTDNQPRALHALMPVLIIGALNTAKGPKHIGILSGISDNLYAFDVDAGQIIWQKRSEERRVGKECRSRWSPYH